MEIRNKRSYECRYYEAVAGYLQFQTISKHAYWSKPKLPVVDG
jgi:hypothetical protein